MRNLHPLTHGRDVQRRLKVFRGDDVGIVCCGKRCGESIGREGGVEYKVFFDCEVCDWQGRFTQSEWDRLLARKRPALPRWMSLERGGKKPTRAQWCWGQKEAAWGRRHPATPEHVMKCQDEKCNTRTVAIQIDFPALKEASCPS